MLYMTVIALRDLLTKEIEAGRGNLPCVIYQSCRDGDFGYNTKHDVDDVCFYHETSFWKAHVEIGKSYNETEQC